MSVPPEAFRDLYLDWDEVRALDAAGFTAGAHTMSHPILTRVARERARHEIADSAAKVAAEVGHRAVKQPGPDRIQRSDSAQVELDRARRPIGA